MTNKLPGDDALLYQFRGDFRAFEPKELEAEVRRAQDTVDEETEFLEAYAAFQRQRARIEALPAARRPKEGHVWQCPHCGKIANDDRYGMEGWVDAGWDESCAMNAVEVPEL